MLLVDAALDASLPCCTTTATSCPGSRSWSSSIAPADPTATRSAAHFGRCRPRLRPAARAAAPPGLDRAAAAVVEAAVASLPAPYATVVADADADVEGEAETGSIDVEDRNRCARLLTGRPTWWS